ncbi:6-carboxytetrahydropterin synthase QueD [Candidatus Gracilibacteria bacterium]|nr:6-carboxytetrahydropterin synthase QueD [Candidatus Gracilibacteria bacterium]
MEITRIFEFDAGHRIPNHHSKCKNMHGHRYKMELTLSGNILETPNKSFEGMVFDFYDVKTIANEFLETLDHAFLVYEKDSALLDFLKNSDSKFVIMSKIPTVENIILFIWKNLEPKFEKKYNKTLKIKRIKLWETPNCFAVYEG